MLSHKVCGRHQTGATPVNPLEEKAGIQGVLDRLEEWIGRNFMKLNKNKSKVLHMGRNDPLEQYRLETDWLGSSSAEKTLGVSADTKPYISQQCALAAKVSSRLDYMSRRTASRPGEVNIPLIYIYRYAETQGSFE